MLPPTERFTSRVSDYVRYRPSYPNELMALLVSECGIGAGSTVADVGAGTGIFSRLLLGTGADVVAVEPNDAMREASLVDLAAIPKFRAVKATAEATLLPDSSVDLVTAAQAFHWFDLPSARKEFERILRPSGYVALVWNERQVGATLFLEEYEVLLRDQLGEYLTVRHQQVEEDRIRAFFHPMEFRLYTFPNSQTLDWPSLLGRVTSSSYAPLKGQPDYEPFARRLQAIFERHAEGGTVDLLYETRLYLGRLG